MTTIAIVGTGPTGVYAFKALATVRSPEAVTIWLFEKGADAGVGMPYSDDTASAVIASGNQDLSARTEATARTMAVPISAEPM